MNPPNSKISIRDITRSEFEADANKPKRQTLSRMESQNNEMLTIKSEPGFRTLPKTSLEINRDLPQSVLLGSIQIN